MSRQAGITYFLAIGGLIKVKITVAFKYGTSGGDLSLIVVPYQNKVCKPLEKATSLRDVGARDLGGGWKSAQITFKLVLSVCSIRLITVPIP